MEANSKLEEASYFLKMLENTVKDTADLGTIKEEISNEFFYNFSAFLSAWRSVFDILLYDYAEKYFGINREKYLDKQKFKKLAREGENQEAIKFIDWYNGKFEILKENPFFEKRRYTVHRGYKELILEYRRLPLKHHGSLTSMIKPKEKRGDASDIRATNNQTARFTYKEANVEITLMCVKALEKMKSIVEEASEKFKI